MTGLKTYLSKPVEAWQWSGPEDNHELEGREFFKSYLLYVPGQYKCLEPAVGGWIIKHADDRYEVMSDKEFGAKYKEVPEEYQPDVTEILQAIVDQLPPCSHKPTDACAPCPICDARKILAWPESEV